MTQQLINIGSAPGDATGDPARIAYDKCNLNFTELYGRSASVSGFAEYKYDSTTTPPPASGYIRANNASVASVTVLYFNNVTSNGSDIKRVLTEMSIGTVMIIQDQDNNVNFGKFTVSATPIDQTSYVQFPVTVSDFGGTLFNNARLLVAVMGGGGGGGGAPTGAEYLTKSTDATLSAERVVTDATAITWDWTTAGQVKAIRAALTGDVTAASDSVATTIANDAVNNAKLANMTAPAFKGRTTTGSGDPEDLTGTQATAMLDLFTSALKGLAPPSGGGTANFLRADATWAAPSGGGPVPTRQVFTSGSGTYTTPGSCRQIEVTLVGGGGGGGGANNTTSGTSGTATTFGAGPLFSAGGGTGGTSQGGAAGAGGTISGSGTPTWSVAGGGGGGTGVANAANWGSYGGIGGNSAQGGAGTAGNANPGSAGGNAAANSGSGGGGGGQSAAQTGYGGAGGGSGATIFVVINTPAATYSYAVGTAGVGAAAGAGSGTFAGGNGAAGIIIVKEIY